LAKSQESQRAMTAKISVVTSPDDVFEDGFRLLVVDLDQPQSEMISSNLLEISRDKIILYSWKTSDSNLWLSDKKNKSDLIIFNADSGNQLLVGYLAAQSNSYYFGTLRDLNIVNSNVILDKDSSFSIIHNHIGNYERQFK
jgi:hypothetical protein